MRLAKVMIVQNKYGYYFIPQSSIDTYTGKKIISGGVHEDSTIEFILNNSKRIVHAGTGFGDFLPALRSLERVWAFEPNKENFIASLKTIEINALTNVRLYNTALNSEDGKLKITDEGVRSQISFDNGNFVEAACMDTMIPESEHIDLIHLDIEGFEHEALVGAKELISRCSPIKIGRAHV